MEYEEGSKKGPRNVRTALEEIFGAALRAVDPRQCVLSSRDFISSVYDMGRFRRVLVAGFGKASCPMAAAIEDCLSGAVENGCIVTKHGHCGAYHSEKIRVSEAGHPVPDEAGLRATREIMSLARRADESTLLICLISGGGSALLVAPYSGITFEEKQTVTGLLLRSGADIHDVNTVRKHLSQIKGGRLAGIAYPATTISLVMSDVIGDRLDVIASGPTAPDETTYADALSVLANYDLLKSLPRTALSFLRMGAEGLFPETPKQGDPVFWKSGKQNSSK